jgi:hypothetical protein
MNQAIIFDLDDHIENTTTSYLTPPVTANTSGTWEWSLITGEIRLSENLQRTWGDKSIHPFEDCRENVHPETGAWIEGRGEVIRDRSGTPVGMKGIVTPVAGDETRALEEIVRAVNLCLPHVIGSSQGTRNFAIYEPRIKIAGYVLVGTGHLDAPAALCSCCLGK